MNKKMQAIAMEYTQDAANASQKAVAYGRLALLVPDEFDGLVTFVGKEGVYNDRHVFRMKGEAGNSHLSQALSVLDSSKEWIEEEMEEEDGEKIYTFVKKDARINIIIE